MHSTGPTTDTSRDAEAPARGGRHLTYDPAGRLLIDIRGPRFGAVITSLVLTTALLTQGRLGVALVVWQWAMFAIAAVAGLRFSVYGNLFRLLKRRFDLGPPPATEPEAGPRFAQACGLAVLTVALVGLALGSSVLAWGSVAVVLVLSLLLASTNVCIGCLLYGVISRLPAPLGAVRR
jgi:hypothetical protein